MDWSAAAVTLSVVEPVMLPSLAEPAGEPVAPAVASPAALIDATLGVAEDQVTWLVRSCVELSEKVPVAVNCCVRPLASEGLAGVTAIDWSTGAVTVRVEEP